MNEPMIENGCARMMNDVTPDRAARADAALKAQDPRLLIHDADAHDAAAVDEGDPRDPGNTMRQLAALRRLEATDRRRLAVRLDNAIQEHGFALRYAPRLAMLADDPDYHTAFDEADQARSHHSALQGGALQGGALQGGAERGGSERGRGGAGRLHSTQGRTDRFGHPRFAAPSKMQRPGSDRFPAGAAEIRARMSGAELIIGVPHRRRGVVPVETYLRSVKRAPVIASVLAEGLAAALDETARWPAEWSLSVVVPPRLADLLALRKALAGLVHDQTRRVALALDEAMLINGGLDALDALDALRSDGFGLILDRFGERFGSLALMRSLPLTGVKLDRTLLHGEPGQRQSSMVLAEACVAIGHDLGLTIIAGGVESESDFSLVRRLGTDAVQGNWVGAALDAAAMSKSVRGAAQAS